MFATAAPEALWDAASDAQPLLSDEDCAPQHLLEALLDDVADQTYKSTEIMPLRWNDIPFAIAFGLQLVGVLATAIAYGVPSVSASASPLGNAGNDVHLFPAFDWATTVTFVAVTVAASGVYSFATFLRLALAMQDTAAFAQTACYRALFAYSLASMALVTTGFQLASNWIIVVLTLMLGASFVVVHRKQQSKLPFAISTLKTVSSTILMIPRLKFLAVVVLGLSCVWAIVWFLAVVGVATSALNETPGCYAALVVSAVWTLSVLRNLLRVATAGAVRSLWSSAESDTMRLRQHSSHLRSTDGQDSLCRACTYSFGSICLGSLVHLAEPVVHVATLLMLQWISIQAIHKSSLSCQNNNYGRSNPWARTFSRFAFAFFSRYSMVFIALYSSTFSVAGRQALEHFQRTKWLPFALDRLVFQVLGMYRGVVVVTTGTATLLAFAVSGGSRQGAPQDPTDPTLIVVFAAGCMMGFVTSSVIITVLESAALAVIVCFAAYPAEFADSHRAEFEILRVGWSAAYPRAWEKQVAVPPEMGLASCENKGVKRLHY